jgi:alpha-L-arabinofuranosidase
LNLLQVLNRIDIAQAFADLKPGHVRFPGGADLMDLIISERFIWNNTIGPLQNRPVQISLLVIAMLQFFTILTIQ